MDYNYHFSKAYNEAFINKENEVIKILKELKEEDIYNSEHYCNKVYYRIETDISNFEKQYPFNSHYHYLDLYNKRNCFKKDQIENLLKLKIKPKFEEEETFELKTFESFIQVFAEYIALIDIRKYYTNLTWLIELYFEFDELDKLKLQEYGNVKTHPDFIRLDNLKNPILVTDLKSGDIDSNTMEFNTNQKVEDKTPETSIDHYDQLINKLDFDEKLLLRSELLSMSTKDRAEIPDTEVARILHISEGVFDNRLFTDKSKNLDYLTKFRQGLYYHKNRAKKQKLLDEIYYKTLELKIDKFRAYLLQHNR